MPTIYKCPGCGAAMEFDSVTQKLGCPSCGMQIDVREYEEKYSQNSTQGEYDKEMKMYHCNTCGAELVADEYTSATFCSFCGNPTLVEDRLRGEFKPSTIIPFKINKDKAVEIYKNWCKKGPLTPSALSRNSTIEKISGLYVPYWLYDYSAQTGMLMQKGSGQQEKVIQSIYTQIIFRCSEIYLQSLRRFRLMHLKKCLMMRWIS